MSRAMDCEAFLERYSEYRDGIAEAGTAAALERHMRDCSCCERYHRVMEEGLDLVASLPAVPSSEDFMPRLRHRLYNVDDGLLDTSRHRLGGSAALVGVAAVGVLALFWLPFAASVPVEVELPAVAAEVPELRAEPVPELFRPGPFLPAADVEPSLEVEVPDWRPRFQARPSVLHASSPVPRAAEAP